VGRAFHKKLHWGNGNCCSLSGSFAMTRSRQQLVYKVRHALRKEGKLLRIPRTAFSSDGICVLDEGTMALLESHASIEHLAERLKIATL